MNKQQKKEFKKISTLMLKSLLKTYCEEEKLSFREREIPKDSSNQCWLAFEVSNDNFQNDICSLIWDFYNNEIMEEKPTNLIEANQPSNVNVKKVFASDMIDK